MSIKSSMSAFLHCMFAPVSQKPLSSTWEHFSALGDSCSEDCEIVRQNKQVTQLILGYWVTANPLQVTDMSQCQCTDRTLKWKKGRKSFFLSLQPLHSYRPNKRRLEKKTIVKILCWPTGHGNVTLLPLYFSRSSASHIFLIALPLAGSRPPLSFSLLSSCSISSPSLRPCSSLRCSVGPLFLRAFKLSF